MIVTRVLLGTVLVLMPCFFVQAQGNFSGNAEITLQFIPPNPTMADGQIEMRVFAGFDAVRTNSNASPVLSSFSMPIGFDPSYVRLMTVSAGQASGYSGTGLSYTSPALANGRGFVTIMNSRDLDVDPGNQVELGRLVFELKRPGNASFIAGSARTVHQGTLAAFPGDTRTPTQRVSWAGRNYVLKIGGGAELPSLLCSSWFSVTNLWQGIALLNEGTEPATVRLFGYRSNGTLVQNASANNPSAPISLPGFNQLARIADQIFDSPGAMNVEDGWIEMRSDSPNVNGFYLQGVNTQAGEVHQMDGVPMSYTPASRLIFPLVRDPNRSNKIALANPGSGTVNITMRVLNPGGQLLRTISGQVLAHGTYVREITDATSSYGVYVDVQASGGKLIGVQRFGTAESLAALSGQDAELASTRLSGPQFVSGPLSQSLRMDTHLALVNPSNQATTAIVRLLNDSGQEIAPPVIYDLAGGTMLSSEGWKLFGLSDPRTTSTLTVGTIAVESDLGLVGALSFGDPAGGKYLAALPLMSTSTASREKFFGQVAVGILGNVDYFTGLALVNPSATDAANINVELHNTDGSILAQTTTPIRLDPGNKTAGLAQQLIPGFPGSQFGGYIRLTSDVEVHAYMLIGDNYYNFLSAVP
jgi:hypothetical protein